VSVKRLTVHELTDLARSIRDHEDQIVEHMVWYGSGGGHDVVAAVSDACDAAADAAEDDEA
jgi:hypothetical protein